MRIYAKPVAFERCSASQIVRNWNLCFTYLFIRRSSPNGDAEPSAGLLLPAFHIHRIVREIGVGSISSCPRSRPARRFDAEKLMLAAVFLKVSPGHHA